MVWRRQLFDVHIFEIRFDLSTLQTDLPSLRKTDKNLLSFVKANGLLKLKNSGF